MDTGSKIYQVDKHKQLIPLNGNVVNFTCFFEVKSRDKKPFNVSVVEQSETKPKEYKLVENGYINGEIESDGQLKTYFLILKSQQPCECEVRVVVKPKEQDEMNHESKNPQTQPQMQQPQMQQPQMQQPQMQQPQMQQPQMQPSKPESIFQLKYILGVAIILIVLYILYKYVVKENAKNNLFELSSSNTSF